LSLYKHYKEEMGREVYHMAVFLFILGLVAVAVGIIVPLVQKKKVNIPTIIGGAVLVVLSQCIIIIPTGYTGVRSVLGQINETTVPNGLNFKVPFIESISKVNNKQQDVTFNGEIWSETSNRTALYYDNVTVTYQIDKSKSAWICANVSNYKDSLVTSSLIASAIKEGSKTLKDEDATNRGIIEPLAVKRIQNSLDTKYGKGTILVNKVVIGNADFEDSYNNAVAAKQKAQLEYEQQQIENKKSIEKAQAEAQAKLIEAEGVANANKALEASLSDMVLKQQIINKWDGTLPQVVGENSNVFDVSGYVTK
jgi:regulator of protease activity HflC (stomatin/prohibitin superfamily)